MPLDEQTVAAAPSGSATRPLAIGIVGATGNVGTMMLRVLDERSVRIASLRAFASSRSAGSKVACGDHSAVVEDLATADPAGLDYALFSAGAERALEHAQRFVDAGVTVIDNSSAFRMNDAVPLVVPEVNAHALDSGRLVANPNCSTIQLVAALNPVAQAAGLDHVHVTTFQAVSGTGHAAMIELHDQATRVLEADAIDPPSAYPRQIAFNVLPHCDAFDDTGTTKEEHKLANETRRIMDLPDLPVSATCVRVPVFNAHSEAVHFQTSQPIEPNAVRALLNNVPGVTVIDDPATAAYPTPIDASGRDDVLVGRIRRDESRPNGIAMFVVADNLRKGAATNAVQILESIESLS